MIMDPISITFPAQKNFALLLRTFMAGACASYDLPVDMLDDLRMAAEEAYDCLLSTKVKEGTQLVCDVYRTAENSGTAHMRLSGRSGQPVKDQENELVYAILSSIMNDVILFSDNWGVVGIRMTLRAEK